MWTLGDLGACPDVVLCLFVWCSLCVCPLSLFGLLARNWRTVCGGFAADFVSLCGCLHRLDCGGFLHVLRDEWSYVG